MVSAPYFTPLTEIDNFIRSKTDWIKKAIARQQQEKKEIGEKQYRGGEAFYYQGKKYPLEIIEVRDFQPCLVFSGRRFYLNSPGTKETGEKLFAFWYKARAKEYLTARVEHFSRIFGCPKTAVKITSARNRWGSCGAENNISFSFRLMMAPPDVIDYVVIHELMHIQQKNHSTKFWTLVARSMPEYKIHRRWLKDNGHLLVF